MTEEELKNKLDETDNASMQAVCNILRQEGKNTRVYLADFVAALCDVEKEKMFSACNDIEVAQARWLYFYAYRKMTNETYDRIGSLSSNVFEKSFTKTGVSLGVKKMYYMIEQSPIWKKRWNIIKRIICEQNEAIKEPPVPITITIPKNVELTIKKE